MPRALLTHPRSLVAPLLLAAACSTGKPPDTSGDDAPGTGGTSSSGAAGSAGSAATSAAGGSSATGQGGASASGGSAADGGSSAATAGSGVVAGAGGASANGGAGGGAGDAGSAALGGLGGSVPMAGMGGTNPGICEELSVISTLEVPTVELLVDTSSSMWDTEPPAWPLLYGALMDAGSGVVAGLQGDIRFGFASYKGHKANSETDAACATMTTVPPALDNRAAIDTVYQEVGSTYDADDPNQKWETPTGYAITYATGLLADFTADPPGKKYILLVTDGNPNTCQITDPQCGQDLSIKAAQDAFAAGIGLFVLGLGDIVAQPDNGCPSAARCGLLHLQDLANAGVGAGVHPTPGCDDWHDSGCTFKNEACNQGGQLLATYTPEAPDVGIPFPVDTRDQNATTKLVTALNELLANAISCTVDMDAIVTGDAALGIVTLDGNPLAYAAADGWKLEDDLHSVTLQGAACETYKAGAKQLDIKFPCDPSGNPIAVHR